MRGLYKGLDAGLARQMTYGMTRLGVFRTLSDWCKRKIERERPTGSAAGDQAPVQLPLWQKGVCALTAGGIGAMVGNPADLAVVRLTADGGLPKALRKNYAGVFDCLSRTAKQEGVLGLWKGSGMTVTRCMAVNLGQLASVSHENPAPDADPSSNTVQRADRILSSFPISCCL